MFILAANFRIEDRKFQATFSPGKNMSSWYDQRFDIYPEFLSVTPREKNQDGDDGGYFL